MHHLSRTLAIVAIVVAGVLGAGAFVAQAQSTQSTQRTVGGPRAAATPGVTPPPLPLGDQSRLSRGEMRSTNVDGGGGDPFLALQRLTRTGGTTRLVRYNGPRPPIPKLTDLLKHKVRHRLSASGASIVLTGTGTSVAYLDDQTVSYGAFVFWLCQNLQPSKTYRYLLFAPDGYAYIDNQTFAGQAGAAWFTTDNLGRCESPGGVMNPYWANVTLQTPLGTNPGGDAVTNFGPADPRGPGIDAAYSGVWAIAVQNQATLAFEAVAYTVVIGTLNFATFSDPGYSVKSNDFTSGSTVYVSASGLNPAHFYAFGFVNTSGNSLPCVGSIPPGASNSNNATCFLANANGILPASGTVSGQFTMPAAGANAAGTYSVQLFDATTNDLISTQQISLNPSTLTWNPMVPFHGATSGINRNDTFATDGLVAINSGAPNTDQSVDRVTFAGTGTINGHKYQITLSNGNGVVMSGTTSDTNATTNLGPQFFNLPPTFIAAGAAFSQQVLFPLNPAPVLTAFGATSTAFAPNVYTAQLYDNTAGAVVGSKSFQIVSYDGKFQWTNPAGGYVNAAAANLPTPVTTTLRNDGGILFGNWNADSIAGITIQNDSAGVVTITRQGTTAVDSLGQTWNMTEAVANTIVLAPAIAGQTLPVNATIAIPINVAAATNACATPCILRTSILPYHGIAASTTSATMSNLPTNGLSVLGSGVVGTNAEPTYSLTVGRYLGPQLGVNPPRYNQMMYVSGTNGAVSNSYSMTFIINNAGAPAAIKDIEFVMPATVDPTRQTPTITSAVVNGVTQTGNWAVHSQTTDGTLGPNAFSIYSTTKTIPVGQSATFVISMPILLASFPFQEIAAIGNHSAGPFSIAPNNTLTNAVAGTQNIDSTELAVFSLSTAAMSAAITPAVVPALAGASWTFKFVNTSTGVDPNPDYISQLLISVPSAGGVYPTSVSVNSPSQAGVTWNANATITPGQYLIDLCAVSTAPVGGNTQSSTPCAGTTDKNALPPGDELDVTFTYAAAPGVSSNPVPWIAVGANGGGVVTPLLSQEPVLVVANTTAQTSFQFAGGYVAAPPHPPVAPIQAVGGAKPTVGSWSDFNNGNAFVYRLHNNGSTNITDVRISIPAANVSGQEFDTTDWTVIASSIFTYGSGAQGAQCSANGYKSLLQPVRPGGSFPQGVPGEIDLSGCNVPLLGDLDVFFYAKSPYDVNSVFPFYASVATGGATPPAPTQAAANTLAAYSFSNTVSIVTDARLVIEIPSAGGWPVGTFFGQSTSTALLCPGCTYVAGSTPLINLNNITGTTQYKDTLGVSVYSDDTNGWNLSLAADVNPSTSSGQVWTYMQAPGSSVPTTGTFTKSLPAVAPGTLIPTGAPVAVSNWTGGSNYHFPIDNIMSYQVTINPLSVNNNTTTTITLTYTLIAN
ncbi:MAG: hypothetical protein JWN27_813 [Candidatus Eremiobacteraeota bacterium]|nr:hypothetical protein [Candidatus Eremiobacteraeota bacterium]